MTLTQLSIDSRMSFTQVYAKTGTYKGQLVALKMYEKRNLQINRKMQKEMKLMRDLRHTNTNAFLGTCIDPPYFIIVTEYCPKGSLLDILENEDLKLDDMFIASLVKDIIQGMIFIHDSELHYHGNLKSSNCVVNSRWSLQITDFGLLEVRAGTYKQEDEHAYYRNLFWKAPEHLRKSPLAGSPKGDVYSFAIILHEIFGRAGPFGYSRMSPREVIERVKAPSTIPYRPNIEQLTCDKYIIECMISCWDENPDERPDFRQVWRNLQPLRHGMKRNIFDNMMAMMEKYQENLEEIVAERTTLLIEEKKKTEALLLRMLPRSVADQLKRGESVIPESYNCVTIYFSDICSFTQLSAASTPMEVVNMLNDLYTTFDGIIRNYDVYKVETIGDAYMVVSGLPIRNGDDHAGEIASMSLHLLRAIKSFKIRHRPNEQLSLRIGMHSGPCVAGVVGLTMPRYTLFGDTVNTASRMETNGEPMKIHCSEESKKLLDKLGGYKIEPRGNVAMKGKGELFTYWLLDEDESVRQQRTTLSNKSLLSLCESQPCTPTTSARCLTCFKNNYRSSPRPGPQVDVLNDNEETNNINSDSDTNFLDLIKMSAIIKSTRSDSPKHFFQQALRSDSPKTCHTIQGHEKIKTNGVLRDNFANKSSSGSNLQRQEISMNPYQEVEDGQTETDSLLVRTHSLGNKPKWRPNSPLRKGVVPSLDGTNVDEFQLDYRSTESLQTSIV
ncbi:hypothetical protein CHS0354_019483 [Potamilus streckersoni]|uniref:Guanylate cyclase n=1 Tax=Potamilus streckersoni TaxID=2493646 RepID=A0AAE0VV13_9BIVA|nr:hypothetical protein CHS0354_019483 [Potamilus streckersoni]